MLKNKIQQQIVLIKIMINPINKNLNTKVKKKINIIHKKIKRKIQNIKLVVIIKRMLTFIQKKLKNYDFS